MFGKRLIKSNDEGGGSSFNTVLYTGNGSTQSISGVGFKPNFVWVKSRSAATSHKLTDIVRGTTKALVSNTTAAETTDANGLSAFGSDGFTLGTDSVYNNSGAAYVAWCWKAGGAAVTNTDGSITSDVSANVDAGFSVVKYTGNGTDGASVGHGLSSAPELIIYKWLTAANSWIVLTTSIDGSADYLFLNNTDAKGDYSSAYIPTSSLFYNNTSSTNELIAYCFHSVAGFSKIGSYTGNGGTNTITIGFEPAFIMFKKTSGDNWMIIDNKRDTKTVKNLGLFPNLPLEELNPNFGVNGVEFLGNGFTITTGDGTVNASGGTYIYMAFANQF